MPDHPQQLALLSNKQKAVICQLARRAYEDQRDMGLTNEQSYAEWRHAEQLEACGKASLTECRQVDYLPIVAHFKILLGETPSAFTDLMRSGQVNEDQRLALFMLAENCEERSTPDKPLHFPQYPAAIAWRQYNCKLLSCTPDQLWNLVYTIRNRGAKRRRKTS